MKCQKRSPNVDTFHYYCHGKSKTANYCSLKPFVESIVYDLRAIVKIEVFHAQF